MSPAPEKRHSAAYSSAVASFTNSASASSVFSRSPW
jgi:hypothetical protein